MDELGLNYYNTRIQFLYNKHQIKFEGNITIGDYFKNKDSPKIIVNDPDNLIGKKIRITFKTNHGYKHEIYYNTG